MDTTNVRHKLTGLERSRYARAKASQQRSTAITTRKPGSEPGDLIVDLTDAEYTVGKAITGSNPAANPVGARIARDVFSRVLDPTLPTVPDDGSPEQALCDWMCQQADATRELQNLRSLGRATANAAAAVTVEVMRHVANTGFPAPPAPPATGRPAPRSGQAAKEHARQEAEKLKDKMLSGQPVRLRYKAPEQNVDKWVEPYAAAMRENVDKWVESSVQGTEHQRSWGREGATPQNLVTKYHTKEQALRAHQKHVHAKLSNGYGATVESCLPAKLAAQPSGEAAASHQQALEAHGQAVAEHVAAITADASQGALMRAAMRTAAKQAAAEARDAANVAATFGMDPGEFADGGDGDAVASVVDALRHDSQLRELLRYVGQLARSVQSSPTRKRVRGHSEPVSIAPTAQLSKILPSELARLAMPGGLGRLAAYQMASGQMLGRETHDLRTKERGDIVVMLDASGSMRSTGWTMSRAIALAAVVVAVQQRRTARLLVFNSGVTFDATLRRRSELPTLLLQVAGLSASGGTSFTAPFRMVGTNTTDSRADVLLVSDGCGHIDSSVLSTAMQGRDLHYFVAGIEASVEPLLRKAAGKRFYRTSQLAMDSAAAVDLLANATRERS